MANRKIKVIVTMTLALIMLFGLVSYDVYASTLVEEDKTKPWIEYAYVEDGVLRLSIDDNEELASKPIVYRIDKEIYAYEIKEKDYEYEYDGRYKEGKVYEIEVEIPSTITINIIDDADNQSTYKFTIKEDYVALTTNVPEFVYERLLEGKQSRVHRFDGYDDVFELEYGKVADAYSLYDQVIKNKYNKYSRNEIKFKISGLSLDKEGKIKLNKYGTFKVTMTHSLDKTFEETAYILVKPNWRETAETRTILNMSPYIVYGDKIKVGDYFKYEDEVGSKKTKLDATYLLVYNEETDQTVGMNDQINLELNKVYNLQVLNFEDNSQHDFYVMRQEKMQTKNKEFRDVSIEHWASADISNLVSKGLFSGYPNGTFSPNGNITVKEFMTILSRYIATTKGMVRPVIGNVNVPTDPKAWGYIESKSILDRLSTTDLYKFNYANLDRPINREEVAFLLDSVLELGTSYIPNANKPLVDAASSIHYAEITKLYDLELISGYPDGTFRPKNNITRAEIAAIFARIK